MLKESKRGLWPDVVSPEEWKGMESITIIKWFAIVSSCVVLSHSTMLSVTFLWLLHL